MKVSIRGINSFLLATEGKMSQKELIDLVQWFFGYRGVSTKRFTVEFCWGKLRNPKTKLVLGGRCFSSKNRVKVYLGLPWKARRPIAIGRSMFHELDHACWKLKGMGVDYSLPCFERPHEKRAQKAARIFRFPNPKV